MATQFVPAGEQLAAFLDQTGGSLAPLRPGLVTRVSAMQPHDMSKPWRGRELTWDKARVSHWTKSIVISLGWEDGDGKKYVEFTVSLAPPMTAEEITNAAAVYMMSLNLRRME